MKVCELKSAGSAAAVLCLGLWLPPAAAAGSSIALLQLDHTAQSQALGDGGAVLSGLNALGVNPAGLYTPQPELLTQYQQLPQQTSLALLGASYPSRLLGATVAMSYASLRSADFDGRDEQGQRAGAFSTQDQLVGLHLSRPLGEDSPVTLGASVKFLRLGIASESADAVAFDVGARYRLARLPLTLGLAALDLGRGPRFGEQTSSLPTAYGVSAAYAVVSGLELLGGYTRRAAERGDEFSCGAQYWAAGLVALRARLGSAASASGTGVQSLAAGIGLKLMGRHMLDYTFQPFDSSLQRAGAAGSHLLTLTLRFGERASIKDERPSLGSRRPYGPAIEAASEGRFAQAASLLRKAVDAFPRDRDFAGKLARIKVFARETPLVENGDGAGAFVREAAVAYADRGDLQGALALLRQAVNAEPGDAVALRLLNALERRAGLEPTRLSSEEEGRNLAGSYIERARRAVYEGTPEAAITHARQAVTLEPANVTAWQVLGSAYYVAGDKTQARHAWSRALALNPGDPTVAAYLRRVER